MRALWLALGLVLALPATAELRPVARSEPAPPGRPVARTQVETPRGADAAELRQAAVTLDLRRGATARPQLRPVPVGLAGQPLVQSPGRPVLRPDRPPPALAFDVPAAQGPHARTGEAEISLEAVIVALRPPGRPEGLSARAAQIQVAQNAERQAGALCGLRGIQGERLGSVGGPGACGVQDAVRVTAVAGVRLSQPATLTCDTARALLTWTTRTAIPAIGQTGGGLAAFRTGPGYTCRNRNNQAGGRLSEHAFGRAIDIMGFRLKDGSEISVLRGWGSGHGQRLREMWRGACGPFGTVLGPNANRFHRDHFHFDTAAYRSGTYCR